MNKSGLFRILSAFIAGLIFSFGLIISRMIDPQKVLNLLDLFGDWDPSLAFTMIGAIVVTFIGYKLALSRHKPLFEELFRVPVSTQIDRKLLLGAGLFGIGWGLIGLGPGPAIVDLGLGIPQISVFVIALIIGINVYRIAVNIGRGS